MSRPLRGRLHPHRPADRPADVVAHRAADEAAGGMVTSKPAVDAVAVLPSALTAVAELPSSMRYIGNAVGLGLMAVGAGLLFGPIKRP